MASMAKLMVAIAISTVLLLAPGAKAYAATDFGVVDFDAVTLDSEGRSATQAGAHPFGAAALIRFATAATGFPREKVKFTRVDLPAGLIGNPNAVPQCSLAKFNERFSLCPIASQVGVIANDASAPGYAGTYPIYNLAPERGVPAQFGFKIGSIPVIISASLDPVDHHVVLTTSGIPSAYPPTIADALLWGVPADSAHDSFRNPSPDTGCEGNLVNPPAAIGCFAPLSSGLSPKAFISNPVDCAAGPLTTSIAAASWEHPDEPVFASVLSHDSAEPPSPTGVTGCDRVPFQPSLTVQPTTNAAASPSGLEVAVQLPQSENPNGLATAQLRKFSLQLPSGMAVNPSSASGLGSCSEAQIGLGTNSPVSCPESSKLGKVEIETPLLDHQLNGSIYLAEQKANPSKTLLGLYLDVSDPISGIEIKLSGRVDADPVTGQLIATFDNNPQLPFEDLRVKMFGGARASLISPSTCGKYTATGEFTSWAGGPLVSSSSSFQITQGPEGRPCPNGEFSPRLLAGTLNPVGGDYSPFVLRLTREDGMRALSGLNVSLPSGLVGKLAGIPYCSNAALAGISTAEGSGAAQLASPACPAASKIGSSRVAAGSGPLPFSVNTGSVYLAGPYKGAPLSLAVVTPALAGPFDLGNVVVRVAVQVDPETTAITAVSDPLPTILYGIPLELREVVVELNRDRFTLNPTNCEAKQISGTVSGASGASAPVKDRFQVANCERLGFKPKLGLKLHGAPPRRGANPALRAVLTPVSGEANLAKAAVLLPPTELLEQGHIRTVCTRVQFGAGQCPKGSVYGHAKAFSPLLDQPLSGPVYLRSNGGERKLPDLVAELDGQIRVVLVGYIDSVKRKGGPRIRTRFVSVPDAPVSRFVLDMLGGRKSLLANNTNLCKAKPRAEVQLVGQNGKDYDASPLANVANCKKKGGKAKKNGGSKQGR